MAQSPFTNYIAPILLAPLCFSSGCDTPVDASPNAPVGAENLNKHDAVESEDVDRDLPGDEDRRAQPVLEDIRDEFDGYGQAPPESEDCDSQVSDSGASDSGESSSESESSCDTTSSSDSSSE